MKKMKTLFVREFVDNKPYIHNVVTPGCEWVLDGFGFATQKHDGTCVKILNGELWRRYDAKHGKPMPEGAIPCQPEPDPVTGHWPAWIKVTNKDKWHWEVWQKYKDLNLKDGTYELCGPHFNGNPENLDEDTLIPHGSVILKDVPRTFIGIKKYLQAHNIEGIVFHNVGTPFGLMNTDKHAMCKIKRTDFGFMWNGKETKN